MPPKPPCLCKPIPKRLERRVVTIVAGFKSHEGIVLCADTQETVGASKRNIPKLRFEPSHRADSGVPEDELAMCFCGAGNNGAFMDEMTDRAWSAACTATSLNQACDVIATSIKQYYREASDLYQTGYCPETELVYGVKMQAESRLFYSLGPAIVEKQTYATGGQGLYLADFIASRSYRDVLDLKPCVILAAYILFEAKEHIDGCGGQSHIAILRNEETSGCVDSRRIEVMTEFFRDAERKVGDLLLLAADLHTGNKVYKSWAVGILDDICRLRAGKTKELKQRDEALFLLRRFLNKADEDEYGLPMPSGSQKSEDQP